MTPCSFYRICYIPVQYLWGLHMKVKELIEKLKQFDPELTIIVPIAGCAEEYTTPLELSEKEINTINTSASIRDCSLSGFQIINNTYLQIGERVG